MLRWNLLPTHSERKTILFARVQKRTFAVHKSFTQIVFYSLQLQGTWFKVTVNNFTSNRLPNFITTIRLRSVIKNIPTLKCNIAFFTYTWRGRHFSINRPPLTKWRRPRDHLRSVFWFSPMSLLQTGAASWSSVSHSTKMAWLSRIKSSVPVNEATKKGIKF